MDDQQTYLLNGLLIRHFGLGRIVRFRPMQRGRQADSFEVFTAQEKEYLVQLYPASFDVAQLDFAATAVNTLDQHRFSVMPFVLSKHGAFAAEGPQNSRMLVSLAPAGSALTAADYTLHDLSQIGLRLAWMHRLLREQIVPSADIPDLHKQLAAGNLTLPDTIGGLVNLAGPLGWTHGDIQLQALLHDADHQLRAVVDWGLLHWGSPLEDLVDAFIHVVFAAGAPGDRARGIALLEAYASLIPLARIPWTPIVARWCAQRLLTQVHRPLPENFHEKYLLSPERLATAIASCL